MKPGVEPSRGVDDVQIVPAVAIRGGAESEDDSEVIAKQEQGEKIIEGPPDNGPEVGPVDVENLPKGSDAVGLRVAKDFRQGVFVGTVTKYMPPTASDEIPF